MKMRRVLWVLSVLSLLAAVAVCVVWATSNAHTLRFGFNLWSSRYEFESYSSYITFTHRQTFVDMVSSKSVRYPDQRIVIALVLIPIVAGLIELRRRLPRPGDAGWRSRIDRWATCGDLHKASPFCRPILPRRHEDTKAGKRE